MRWRRATPQGRTCHCVVASAGSAIPRRCRINAQRRTLGTIIMRHAIVAVLAAAFFVAPAWAQTPAPPPAENLAAARELVGVMKATDQFKAVLPTIMQGIKPSIVQGRPEVERDYDTIMPV